jgi:DNA-binding transcriptional ArsR family regulator
MAHPAKASVLYRPLDGILGSPALVRVARVLAGHGGSLGVSDIARRAKLSLPSVRAALHRLLRLEVVIAVHAGRSMVCTLRREHPLAPALVAMFEAERAQTSAVLHAIRETAEALRPAPVALWLYGSVARGEDEGTSDIHLALVSAESQPTAQADALRDAISLALPARAHRVSVVALGLDDVERLVGQGAELWRELERDAVVLAGDAPADVRGRAARGGDAGIGRSPSSDQKLATAHRLRLTAWELVAAGVRLRDPELSDGAVIQRVRQIFLRAAT